MRDTGWYDDDVPLFDFSDDPPWIVLPTEAQVGATGGDAQYFVCVACAVHGIAPVWDYHTERLEM